MNTPGARVSNDNTFRRKKIKKTFAEHRELYRKEWIQVTQKFPHLSRTALIKQANHEYLWLMKNDTDWINIHLPTPLTPPRKKDVLDWEKIDEEMSIKVEKACRVIYQSVPLNRVSITEIIRKVGNKKWIENREFKLPKTTETINRNLETLEDFMIRKLRFAGDKFIYEKSIPTRDQLIRRAIINNQTTNNSDRVQNEITDSLSL